MTFIELSVAKATLDEMKIKATEIDNSIISMGNCSCVKKIWSYSYWPYVQYTQEACMHGVRFIDGEESYKRFMSP